MDTLLVDSEIQPFHDRERSNVCVNLLYVLRVGKYKSVAAERARVKDVYVAVKVGVKLETELVALFEFLERTRGNPAVRRFLHKRHSHAVRGLRIEFRLKPAPKDARLRFYGSRAHRRHRRSQGTCARRLSMRIW